MEAKVQIHDYIVVPSPSDVIGWITVTSDGVKDKVQLRFHKQFDNKSQDVMVDRDHFRAFCEGYITAYDTAEFTHARMVGMQSKG